MDTSVMNIEELEAWADNFNREEIKKYKSDIGFLHDIAFNAGIRLAKEYGADEQIVKVALALMDSKLPEASHLGVAKEHVSMALDKTKEILKDNDVLNESVKENILKCIEEHHGVEKFFSIESEVVANADCYKFVHPKGVLYYASMLGRRFHDFDKELDQLNFKLNEKHNALSLPMVKEELESYYQFFQKVIDSAKNK